jgi:hypothetical protein
MRTHILSLLCIAVLSLFASPLAAQNHKIDFEDFAGPARFDAAQPPARALSATISGGEVLRNATLGGATRTSVYATSHECAGCSPEISIQFNQRVANVEVSYISQQTVELRYTMEDDRGNLQEIISPEPVSAGAGTVNLPYCNIR